MGVFDTWAEFVIKVLNAESDYSAALVKHPVLLGDARETIIKSVLKRILPSAFEIGRGQVMDSDGNRSKQIDIVIARNDSPALSLPSGDKVYLVEAVLATIEVKSALDKDDLKKALHNCASIADLNPRVHGPSRRALLEKLNIAETTKGTLYHPDYLELQRYSLKGYPATYIYGFKGYPQSRINALGDDIIEWLDERTAEGKDILLRHLPAVIATEGCFGCRNAMPFTGKPDPGIDEKPHHFLFGKEDVPLRLLTSHLLATLYSKIPWHPDIEGLQMEPRRYIEQVKTFGFENGITLVPPADYTEAEKNIYWEGFPSY